MGWAGQCGKLLEPLIEELEVTYLQQLTFMETIRLLRYWLLALAKPRRVEYGLTSKMVGLMGMMVLQLFVIFIALIAREKDQGST